MLLLLSYPVKSIALVDADIRPGKYVRGAVPNGAANSPSAHDQHVIVDRLILSSGEIDGNNYHLVRGPTVINRLAVVSPGFNGASDDTSIEGKSDFVDPRGCNLLSTRP